MKEPKILRIYITAQPPDKYVKAMMAKAIYVDDVDRKENEQRKDSK